MSHKALGDSPPRFWLSLMSLCPLAFAGFMRTHHMLKVRGCVDESVNLRVSYRKSHEKHFDAVCCTGISETLWPLLAPQALSKCANFDLTCICRFSCGFLAMTRQYHIYNIVLLKPLSLTGGIPSGAASLQCVCVRERL